MKDISTSMTVNMKQVRDLVLASITMKQPLMIWGPPGIGKSDVVAQVAKELGRDLIDIRLPNYEPTDIKGIPFYNPQSNLMEWGPASELPQDPNSNAVLFLDEINGADENVQGAAYQLILNRKIGQYELPENVVVIAAGNRDGDGGVTYRMPRPLANRFMHTEAAPDFDSWKSWAVRNDVHPDVVGYLEVNKQDLFDFNSKSSAYAFATPRSWSFVSKSLKTNLSEETTQNLVIGSIGEGIGIKFNAFRKMTSKLPMPEDVLYNKADDLEEDTEISAMYALSTSLCYELKLQAKKEDIDLNSLIDNFLFYLMRNFKTEIAVTSVRSAIRDHEIEFDPTKLKAFDKFQEKYGKQIFSALGITR